MLCNEETTIAINIETNFFKGQQNGAILLMDKDVASDCSKNAHELQKRQPYPQPSGCTNGATAFACLI
jgi:hypothetical protein